MSEDTSDETSEETSKLDSERAMVFLGTHGSTTYPPQKWESWVYAETDYAPEWLGKSDLAGLDNDQCVTVLDFSLSDVTPPRGYRVLYQYAAGEKDCPWCGAGTGEESKRSQCDLCEHDGLLYWGEECQVVVMGPIDPSATLTELRELMAKRDMFGHLPALESHRVSELFDSLDGLLSRSGSELPEQWGNHE